MLCLPFLVRHAVNDLAAFVLAHAEAFGVGCVLHPVRQAIAAEARQIHHIDVLHVGARAQMLDQAPEHGRFKLGARLVVHRRRPLGPCPVNIMAWNGACHRRNNRRISGRMDKSAGQRAFLETLFRAAVAAAHPSTCLPPLLPSPPAGRIVLLAAGKAAASMAQTAEEVYLDRLKLPPARLGGVAVARHGYGRPTRVIEMIEAGHPIPDAAGLKAAEKALRLAESAGADDLVLVLMSGGASANWIAPAEGLSFADKQAVTRALLRSGAAIGEINAVRKHLSRIKGGRLARRAYPARL